MHGDDFAYTEASGKIHIRDDVPSERVNEVLNHELTHVMKRKRYQPYLDFVTQVPAAVDLTSEAGSRLLKQVAKHRGIDLSKPLTIKDAGTISDEIAALVRGAEMSGRVEDILGDLRDALDDYDAFARELDAIHRQYVAEQRGAPVSYADALREAKGQNGKQTGLYAQALAKLHGRARGLYASAWREIKRLLGGGE